MWRIVSFLLVVIMTNPGFMGEIPRPGSFQALAGTDAEQGWRVKIFIITVDRLQDILNIF